MLIFLLVAGGLFSALHRYVWARLIRDPELPPKVARPATIALVVMATLLILALPITRFLPRSAAGPVAVVVWGWLGLLFLTVVALAATDLVRFGVALAERVRAEEPDPRRRVALRRTLAALAGVVAAGASGVATAAALGPVEVKRVRVPLRRLPKALDGLSIVQLTDVHIGPTLGRKFLEPVVAKVNGLSPDVIVITGDLVDGSVEELREHVAPLAALRAVHGVFFVTGNHEYYSGVTEWVAELARLGIRVLRNERVEIGRDGHGFDLAGVDDWTAHQFGRGHGADLARALEGRDPNRELVLLAHQPKAIDEAAKLGVGLQLSGHTHGGQIWPFGALVTLQQPYVAGLHRHGESWIYVSRGTGFWGPPMRLAAPAEITHVQLVCG
jgi:predicted MPP superfamily phosphohydrolase